MSTTMHTATRQQLDELDSLLQKMLDGPSKPLDPPAAPVFPSGRVAEVPRVAPTPAPVAEVPKPLKSEPAVPTPAWNIDLNPKSGSSVLGERSPLAERLAAGEFGEPEPTTPQLFVAPVAPVASFAEEAVPLDYSPRSSLLNWPAVQMNAAFDSWASSWGWVGRVATSRFGRTLLGYAGLAMLCYSVYCLTSMWASWSAITAGLR